MLHKGIVLVRPISFFLGHDAFPGRNPLSGHTPPQPFPASDQGDHGQPAAPRHGLSLPGCKEGGVSPP